MVEKGHIGSDLMSGFWPRLPGEIQSIARRVANYFAPESDACATQDTYEINIELPGVSQDDIDVAVHDNVLLVKGEKKYQHEEKGKTYFFSERAYGAFQRSFRLPPDSAADKIQASFKDGVLTIHVPKTGPQKEEAQKIKVRSG
ncbi:MAG TPA: Hsp20/alpha crystallin family protein [Alphaproteobacteria bacterium]|nr:Hsp20/alpha crystallin family protein [Alphaproteobacteria bacterium]